MRKLRRCSSPLDSLLYIYCSRAKLMTVMVVEERNVEGAKSDEEATYEEDQGNEAVEDTNTILMEEMIQHTEATSLIDTPVTTIMEPSFTAQINRPPTPLKTRLEDNFSELRQTNQYAEALSSIPGTVDQYLANKMQEAEQVKKEVSKIIPKIEKLVTDQLESEVLVRSSKEANTSHAVAANLSELELKKILIDKMEANNSINRSEIQRQLYKALVDANPPLEQTGVQKEEGQERPCFLPVVQVKRQPDSRKERTTRTGLRLTSNLLASASIEETMATLQMSFDSHQHNQDNLATTRPSRSFDELTTSTFDFSAFVMESAKCSNSENTELLQRPTFERMKGTCKSLTELDIFVRRSYKPQPEKLDWINPEGRQYPHDLRQPLPLVPNSQGRHVIPFHHFINNDLKYLRGGVSSRKYSTLVTKTTATDYGHIKWIEDLVPNSMESARDIYSKRRIIAVTKVEIVEWHNYKHLDWITVRRDDDVLYKFKEGDFHRLRIQDIEDMLLLLVQGKVTNLNVEERIALNVSLRMFTRSVVIQRRVEDLQLGVESYHKKLNLIKPDTYRSNLRRQDAYTPYSDPRGFIYENKDKKNRLMRIDELHKFSDGYSRLNEPRVNSFTMKLRWTYLLDSTSNQLMVEHAEYDESNTYVLERFNTTAGNPVKKILLKLNLSDHRLLKMVVEVPDSSYFRYSDTTHLSRSVKVLKLKNLKKDATFKLFKNGMSMSVQKSQVHKMAKLQDGVEIVLG
ncbi:hypothetical protein Tco_0655236 [Tanacetum coccineum]|uniref:Uncharacterized protein n=1 Tax=Tanacetum coccineum TaxID=301880 RepID=A0ABQ4X5F6_9ASTR